MCVFCCWYKTYLLIASYGESANDCSKAPNECQTEFNNGKNNGNLESFYQRCNSDNSFGKRCILCCNNQNTGTI